MRLKVIFLAFVVLLFAPIAIGQAASADLQVQTSSGTSSFQPSADAPSHDEVMEFMRLMHADRQINLVFDQMQLNMKRGMREGFLSKVPNASPEVLAKVDSMAPDFRKYVSVEDMLEASVKVYEKNLTKRQLQAATAFYKSPEGQQLLEKLPVITQESMQAGAALMEAHRDELIADMEARMKELEKQVRAEQKPAPAAPKTTAPKSTTKPKGSTATPKP